MTNVLRTAYVNVAPNTDGFDVDLKEQLRRKDPGGKAGKLVGSQLNAALRRVNIDTIDIKANPKQALASIAVTEERLKALSRDSATVEVKVRTERALGELRRFRKQLGDIGGEAGPEAATGFFTKFSQKLGPLLAKTPLSSPLIATMAGAAVLAAPLIGATISGAVIGGAGLGGVVGGLVLASKDPRVKAAATQVGDRLKERLQAAGSSFVGPAIAGLGEIESAIAQINIEGILRDSAKFVQPLTAGISSALVDLGSGIEKLIHNAGPAIESIGSGIAAIGKSLGDGLASLSDNGDSAANALAVVFKVVQSGIDSVFLVVNGLTELYGWLNKIGALGVFTNLGTKMAAGMQLAATAAGGLADAAATVTGAVRGEIGALTDLSNKMKAEIDPVFGLITAEQGLATAQKASAEAIKKHGKNSDEARAATRNLALAAIDLQGKAGALSSSFDGKLSPSMVKTFKAAGLTDGQIKDVAKQAKQAKSDLDKYDGKYVANVSVTGDAAAMVKLRTLNIMQNALRKGVSLSTSAARSLAGDAAAAKDRGVFDGGGWTGPGATHDEAGIVHADEFVIKKWARQKIENRAPGLLNEMNATGQVPGYAGGGQVWPFAATAAMTRIPSKAEAMGAVTPSFGNWPSSPAAQRGDSGVWRSIVALIKSTGPLSGHFGNAYRPGDPLWHGSGRAVDWMGENQDRLASFLAARRPLELIHRTSKRDYAYTRGVNKGSFNNALMNAHRNHVHIAMANGGVIREPVLGIGASGRSYSFGEHGRPETVTPGVGARGGDIHLHFHGPVASKQGAKTMVLEAIKELKNERKL